MDAACFFPVPSLALSTGPRSSICLGLGQRSGRPPPQSSSWAVQRSSHRKGDTGRWQESDFQLFPERLSAALPESLPEPELPVLLLPRLSRSSSPDTKPLLTLTWDVTLEWGTSQKDRSKYGVGIATGRDPGLGNRALPVRWLPGLYSQQNCRRT